MLIGQRLRKIRISNGLTQDDIALRTGLARPNVSCIENGRAVPTIQTLEKWARALEMRLYQVLYEGEKPPKPHKGSNERRRTFTRNSKREEQQLYRLWRYLVKMDESERDILLVLADWMAGPSRRK